MRPRALIRVFLASLGYVLFGYCLAEVARNSFWAGDGRVLRLAAWALCLLVFIGHFAVEWRQHHRARKVAAIVATAVALGAVAVAALGPLRSHWHDPMRGRLIALSLLAWPLVTGVPAYVISFIAGTVLERSRDMRVIVPVALFVGLLTAGCGARLSARHEPGDAPPSGQSRTTLALVGTWRLVEFWDRDSIGAPKRYRYGESPTGYFTYDPTGHVSIQIQRGPAPPRIQSERGEDWFRQASADELRTSVEAYRAYFGTYTVDDERAIVIHHVEGDSRGLYTGTAQRRHFRLVGDSLIIGNDTTARRVLLRVRSR